MILNDFLKFPIYHITFGNLFTKSFQMILKYILKFPIYHITFGKPIYKIISNDFK